MKLFVAFAALVIACVSAASLDAIVRPGYPNGRIINGHPAVKGEAPFIVSLKTSSHFCGGSIIDKHWVITAAHCLTFAKFEVIAGLYDRADESDVQVRQVNYKQLFPHEKYRNDDFPYDIGLIYIEEPFDLNALSRDGSAPVAPIKLPSGKYEQVGRGKLFGWGRDNTGYLSSTLQTLDVDVIDYAKCKTLVPITSPLEEGNICSHTAGTSDGACNGDSGGPLVMNTKDGYELVGLVSWGYKPCSSTEYPSIYTNVSHYKQWVIDTMAAHELK
uniref:Putative trypsin-like serine protease n=1 Tax=Haematobia irritans TaxID=7368 RepID=A0A1L8EBE2_HAEIR